MPTPTTITTCVRAFASWQTARSPSTARADSTLSMPLRPIEIERQDAKPIAPPIILS
jgi:hypothetical protein